MLKQRISKVNFIQSHHDTLDSSRSWYNKSNSSLADVLSQQVKQLPRLEKPKFDKEAIPSCQNNKDDYQPDNSHHIDFVLQYN